MYKKLSFDNIKLIENMMLESGLTGKIIYQSFPELNTSLKIDSITVPKEIQDGQYASAFTFNEAMDVVEINKNKYLLLLEIWERIIRDGIFSINVALSCNCEDFRMKFGTAFYQIELADSLEDQNYVYIVRDVSRLIESEGYTDALKFGCEIISHDKKRYLLISKFGKKDLKDLSKHREIFTDFVENFIRCGFIGETFK